MLKRKTPLRSKSGFKNGGRLRAVSKSKHELLKEYAKVRGEYLREHPLCECCKDYATQIHHKSGRGKYLCDKSTFMAACWFCHRRIHDNPAWAKERGFLEYKFT
jgi:hypothetical protein